MLLDIGQSDKAAATPVNSHPTGARVHCHSVNLQLTDGRLSESVGLGLGIHPKTWTAVTLGRCKS